jgi:hypothetical protein
MPTILEQSGRHGEVEGRGYLERPLVAGDDAHLPTAALDEPGIIGRGPTAGVRVLQNLAQKTLRGLYAAQ